MLRRLWIFPPGTRWSCGTSWVDVSKACCSSSAATLAPGWSFCAARSPANPKTLFTILHTPFLAEIADALGRDGKAAEGLSIIDEALARSERNEERWCVAELLRIKCVIHGILSAGSRRS